MILSILLILLSSYYFIFLDSATNLETSTWRASIFLFVFVSSAWYLSLLARILSKSSLNAFNLAWRSLRFSWDPWAYLSWSWRNLSCSWIVLIILLAPSISSLKFCILFLNLSNNLYKNPVISLQLTWLLAALTINNLTSFDIPVSITLITSSSLGNLLKYGFLSSPLYRPFPKKYALSFPKPLPPPIPSALSNNLLMLSSLSSDLFFPLP